MRIAAKETFEFGLAMGEEFVHGFVAGENLPFKDLLARATLNYGLGKVAGAAIGAGGRYLGSLGGGLRHRNVKKRGKPTSPEPGEVGRGGAGRNQDLPTKQVRQCKVNCFSGGTPVATEEGSATIETLEAGDRVWAFDETSNKVELRQILQTFSRQRDEIYVLSFGDETIRTTSEHPFFVEDRGWVEAEDLEVGDLIRKKSGESIRLDMIEIEEGAERVFNFSVEGLSTYFVGDGEVLVHNCGELAELQQRAKNALEPLAQAFPDAQAGFRGSLARGRKGAHKDGVPFDPADFDVDAFVVSDALARITPKNRDGFRNLARNGRFFDLVQSPTKSIKKIPGVRQHDVFKVRVFSESEFDSIVGLDERFFLGR